MMMMLDFFNVLVEFVIMSMPNLSHKYNYYTFIPSTSIFIGGCGDIYIYINIYIGTIRLSCCQATMYSCCLVVIHICICHVGCNLLCTVRREQYNQQRCFLLIVECIDTFISTIPWYLVSFQFDSMIVFDSGHSSVQQQQ